MQIFVFLLYMCIKKISMIISMQHKFANNNKYLVSYVSENEHVLTERLSFKRHIMIMPHHLYT